MRILGKTDIGRSRDENQDNFRSGSLTGGASWGIVCDGMGGAQNGRLASTVAADAMEDYFFHNLHPGLSSGEVEQLMRNAMQLANAEVFAISGGGEQMMGTTAVCAVVLNGRLHMAHVGDSRAYLFENGKLKQITRDHSVVQELVDKGALTAEAARRHPGKNVITRALGVEEDVEMTYSERPVNPGAIVLLCTDGLTNLVGGARITEVMAETDFFDLPAELVSDALLAGGHDNITVLLMQVGEGD